MTKIIDKNTSSNEDKININNRLVEELLSQADHSELFGKDGLFQSLKKQLVNKILEKEMESHIGYQKHSKEDKKNYNRRNGSYERVCQILLVDITFIELFNKQIKFQKKFIRNITPILIFLLINVQ